ncbi:MAG: hypothetical protein WD670_10730 [Actinomycetota bacterium]
MTTVFEYEHESTHGRRDRTPRRSVALLVPAGVVVVAVVVLVLLVGIQRPPALEPLGAAPAVTPPGSVAWIDHDSDIGCLRAVDPSGVVRDVSCEVSGEVLAWDTRGIVVRDWTHDAERLIGIDPDTGEQRILEISTQPGTTPLASAFTQRVDGRLQVSVFEGDSSGEPGEPGERPTIWEVAAPDGYDVLTAAVSADGTLVALGDNAGRLLLAPADGSAAPRLWTDEVARYATVVWEQTPLGDAPA